MGHHQRQGMPASTLRTETDVPSRASPEVDMAEMEGQYFDPSSGLTFLHRAYNKLATSQQRGLAPHDLRGLGDDQPLMRAGDRPFVRGDGAGMPERHAAVELLAFYFDVCVVTYHIFHQPTVTAWLDAMLSNTEQGLPMHHGLSHGKAAIILTILAISTLRRAKVHMVGSSELNEEELLGMSDPYFVAATELTETETGLPRLESAQARLIQVLYLLQTSRMNQAWYVFGTTSQIVSALGLHRGPGRKRHNSPRQSSFDYINDQCRKRTFWAAYIIDKYLSVVFGRPMQHHDEDIDQEFPDSVNDEDMTPQGPSGSEAQEDCHLDAMVFHAKIAKIFGLISREVYTTKPIATRERVAAAHRAGRQLHEWRAALPVHLGNVKPSSLIPRLRRQAIALKLAYSHAIMHANRPFLLGHKMRPSATGRLLDAGPGTEAAAIRDSVAECISAARMALEIINGMASDGTLFNALWWSSYVTFCALAVVYVCEIQRGGGRATSSSSSSSKTSHNSQHDTEGGGGGGDGDGDGDTRFPPGSEMAALDELAERCRARLNRGTWADSPNQRYSIVLEELRLEARRQRSSSAAVARSDESNRHGAGNRADADLRGLAGVNISGNAGGAPLTPAPPPPPPPPQQQQQQQQQEQDPSYAAVGNSALYQVGFSASGAAGGFYTAQNLLDGWQASDWLELDSSGFGTFAQTYGYPGFWDAT